MSIRVSLLLATVLAVCIAPLARGQDAGRTPSLPPAPAPTIDDGALAAGGVALDTVVNAALRAHPEIRASEQTWLAATQRPVQEGSLPDPMVSSGYTSMGNPLPGGGLGSDPNANLSVMVSQEIPYFGKRALRRELATREAEVAHRQLDTVRLALVSRVKQAYFRLAAAYQLDEVLQRNDELLSSLLKVSETRYSVGQAPQQDVIRAQTELSLLVLQRQRVARERRTREGELNALLNRPPDSPLGRPVALAPFALEVTLADLVAAANEHSPMLQRERSMVTASQAAIAVAQRDFKPDFVVSGEYGYSGSMPDMYRMRFDVVVPLQRAKRRAAVAERQNQLEAARQTVEASRLSLQGRLQEDYEMAATAGQLATLYQGTVLTQARLALESSLSSYQSGTVEFLSVLTNFGSVLEYEMSYIEQLLDLHVAATRLEEMSAATVVR